MAASRDKKPSFDGSRRALCSERIVSGSLLLVGLTIGTGLRMAEPAAYAYSVECDDSHRAQLVEVRRVAGTGTIESQNWWRASLRLLATYNEFSVSDTRGSSDFRLDPEAAE